jgi:RNA polymerase sigma factor (sigma-70 family)
LSVESDAVEEPSGQDQPTKTVVTTTAVPSSRVVNLTESQPTASGVFRISRATAEPSSLEVHYTLTTGQGSQSTVQEGSAVIASGETQVQVAVPSDAEIATLTLRVREDYRIEKTTATLFRDSALTRCSEAALLTAYRDGQSMESFTVLVERHTVSVFRTCSRILGNTADAEDVSQLVFLKLAQMQVPLTTTLASWLATVARNAAIEFLRGRNRRKRHETQAAKLAVTSGVDDNHELRDELDTALDRLPGPLAEAVRLRYLEGRSQQEAAELVGCPRGTLSQRAARGIVCLRTILAGESKNVG